MTEPGGSARPDPAVTGCLSGGPGRSSPRVRISRRAGVLVLGVLVLAAAVVEGRALLIFRATTPWSAPTQIHFCGRSYAQGDVVSAARVAVESRRDPLERMMRGPLGQPVYGHPSSEAQRARLGVPCTMTLLFREGDGYRVFVLSGGP